MYYSHSGDSTVLLQNGDALVYGNHFACYASEYYSPSTNTWTNTGSLMNQRRRNHTLTLLSDGRALATGGLTINASGVTYTTATAELYTP